MDLKEILKDGGFKSRKLLLTVYAVHTLALGWLACARWKALTPEYPTFVGGVIGLVALYFGGNVSTKATLAKAATSLSDEPAQPPSP